MAETKNIRAFLAIEPPEEVLAAVTRLQEKLKGEIAGKISWTRPQSNHLTLKFFGDIGSTDVEKIGTAVKIQLATVSSIVLKIEKIGVFPDLRRPRVIWAGTTGDIEKLTMLQNKLDVDFAGLGFPPENRPFRAHLTLGRIKMPHGVTGIGEAIGFRDGISDLGRFDIAAGHCQAVPAACLLQGERIGALPGGPGCPVVAAIVRR